VAVKAPERGIAGLRETCALGQDEVRLFAEVSERLRKVVPFDGSAWFGTDPATILATSPVRIENVETGQCDSYWERECLVEDALLFRDVARSDSGIGSLYQATDGQPGRSARYREFLAPQGYGDEIRAALRVGKSTWGVIDLFRDRSRPAFTTDEIDLVQSVVPALGGALQTLARRTRVTSAGAADGPGTALFGRDGAMLSLDETAEQLFAELAGPRWSDLPLPMTPVYAAVARASAIDEGRDRGPASTRIRATSGRWLHVRASCLRGRGGEAGSIAVTIEPAVSAQIAPIIVEAYRLTPREQEVTRAVARGLSNPEIAAELYLSPHTVRDHLKAIFTKTGVASRGELVAKFFAEHYGPAMHSAGAFAEHVEVG
jgi:DNA-binding CsgD family transcriptional regulator